MISLDDIQKPHITIRRGEWRCSGSGMCAYGVTPANAFNKWNIYARLFGSAVKSQSDGMKPIKYQGLGIV